MDTIICLLVMIMIFLIIIIFTQKPTWIFKDILSTLEDIEKHLNTIEENTKNDK